MRASCPTILALALALALAGCRGPRLPEQLSFEGLTLKKVAEWKLDGVQSVVFVPEGETLRQSTLQVGVLTSTKHSTARELNVWLMKQYRLAQVARGYESVAADTACKVGRTQVPFREFVAVHVCRDGSGMAVCVEADAMLTPEMREVHGADLCDGQWARHREALEALVERVVVQR